MLVMEISMQRMRMLMNGVQGHSFVYKIDKGPEWHFYLDISDNVVLKAREAKVIGEQSVADAAAMPSERIIQVASITWGQHIAVTSILQETKELAGKQQPDIIEESAEEVKRYRS